MREASPAGLKAANAEAWYQTLDAYAGSQETFHARHLTTPFAKQVMNLNCTFCHEGADPREKAPGSSATIGGQGCAVHPAENRQSLHDLPQMPRAVPQSEYGT